MLFQYKNTNMLKSERIENIYHKNVNHEIAQVTTLIFIKTKFRIINIIMNIKEYFIMIKGTVYLENIIIFNI